MTERIHHCHAAGCTRHVRPKYLCCSWHWYRLHPQIQSAIWREYRNGQEVSKTPSVDYMAVQQCAVAYLAKIDGLKDEMAKAALNAVAYEAKAREQGREPLRALPRAWE